MYKLFYFYFCPITGIGRYYSVKGLWTSVDAFFEFLVSRFGDKASNVMCCNFIKIPFFGYHSNSHTGFSLSDLRAPRSEARRPEK